ncbi:hypothetical protein EJ08DRAFT_665773 [Tothia fuscella]|uniref:DUF6604 domain-containing protein n=1 Tax=Tothia fuscella TaxID=1048955 RepID=A0A9P4NG00_9PEZI|nr:hypothetical protein EJ08DRAFT_665773 [Tothia fuscella]
MLPDTLTSSYSRYKEYTNVFTTWLGQAAKKCGYQSPHEAIASHIPFSLTFNNESKAPRLKGKARKLAKEAAKEISSPEHQPVPVAHKVTTLQLLQQAELVANCAEPKITIPEQVRKILQRAIFARERCAKWFQKAANPNVDSDEGHAHFIGVLQQASVMLCQAKNKEVARTGPVKEWRAGKTVGHADLHNRFAELELENDNDGASFSEDLNITALDVTAEALQANETGGTSTRNAPLAIQASSEIEVNFVWEFGFMMFCFFEDLQSIKDHLVQTWKCYRAGDLDLITATIVTTAAFELVRQAEIELIAEVPEIFAHTEDSYRLISRLLLSLEATRKGPRTEDVTEDARAKRLEISDLEEFVFRPTSYVCGNFAKGYTKVRKWDGYAWPPKAMQMRLEYCEHAEMLNSQRMAKFEWEDRRLVQLLMDLCLEEEMETFRDKKYQHLKVTMPYEDALKGALRPLWDKGAVSTFSVFAAQVSVELQSVLADGFEGTKILEAARTDVDGTFKFVASIGPELFLTGGGTIWPRKDVAIFGNLFLKVTQPLSYKVLAAWKRAWLRLTEAKTLESGELAGGEVQHTRVDEITELCKKGGYDDATAVRMGEAFKKMNPKIIQSTPDPNFVAIQNPLYAGNLLLDMVSLTEVAGIHLSTACPSIFAVAYLYHASRTFGLLDTKWPAMETILERNVGPIFAGTIPQTAQDMYKLLRYRMGDNPKVSMRRNKKKTWALRMTPIAQPLRQSLEGKEPLSRILYQLDVLAGQYGTSDEVVSTIEGHGAVGGAEDTASSQKIANPFTPQQKYPRRLLTPVQSLARLKTYLSKTLPDMHFDYIGLTRSCNTLLCRVRSRVEKIIEKRFPRDTEPGSDFDHAFICLVLTILHDSETAFHAQRKSKKKTDTVVVGENLKAAACVLRDFLHDMQDGTGAS